MTGAQKILAALLFALAGAGCAREAPDCKSAEAATTTTTGARADANRNVVLRFIEDTWTKRDPDAVSRYVATDLVNHAAIPEAQGAAGLRTILMKLQKAFPDMQTRVVGASVEGDDLVVVRVTQEGTHTADLEFKKPLPATNKHMKIDEVHSFRVKEGKIVETWMVQDRLDLLTQLGALR